MSYRIRFERSFEAAPLLLAASMLAGCTISPGMRNEIDRGNVSVPGLDVVNVTPEVVLGEVLSGATGNSGASAAVPPADLYQYRLGAGDVVRVVVWEHPELNNPSGQAQGDSASSGRLIEPDGTFFFPYVGQIKAAGLTAGELRQQISRPLGRYIRDPQVDVRVTEFRSQRVYVSGEVASPGPLYLGDTPMGALDAIAGKGGFTELSNRRRAYLTRAGVTTELLTGDVERGNAAANVRLQAGDLVHVPDTSSDKILLLGEFAQQKAILQGRSSISLAEALVQGGGLDKLGANAGAIFVFRRKADALLQVADSASADAKAGAAQSLMPKVYILDLTRAESLLLAERFPLKPHDVVYVASTDFSKYNRIINQLLPTVTTYFQLDRLINN